MTRNRVLLAVLTSAAICVTLPSTALATHNTEFCRNEPSSSRERYFTVNDGTNEIAFVGADTDFEPGTNNVLVCFSLMGSDANVGVVNWPRPGIVTNCSPSRPLATEACYLTPEPGPPSTAAVALLDGFGVTSPGIPVVGLALQNAVYPFYVATFGLVDNGISVGAVSACVAESFSVLPESYAAGAGTGWWECGSGPLDGASGTFSLVRAGMTAQVMMSGALAGTATCVITPNQPIGSTIYDFQFSCAGPTVGL